MMEIQSDLTSAGMYSIDVQEELQTSSGDGRSAREKMSMRWSAGGEGQSSIFGR